MSGFEIVEGVWLDAAAMRKIAAAIRTAVSDWTLSRVTRKPFGFLATNEGGLRINHCTFWK